MKPIGFYVLVKPVKEEVKSESGIILSGNDVEQLRYHKGIIIEIGTDVSRVNKDDVVYFDKHNSFELMINDVPHTIIREGDIVIVV